MGKTTYCPAWEETYKWISKDSNGDSSKAHCKYCKKTFRIDNSGHSQVKSHAESESHKKLEKAFGNQKTFVARTNKLSKISLSSQDEITRAEAVHSLFYVDRNIPYACSTEQSEIFRSIFPCDVTKSFTCSATKMSYVVKYELAPHFEKILMTDIDGIPFGFKFDETTTKQVKKQYDAYGTYWSKASDQVETTYLGSLFVGHCKAVDLVDHYLEFKQHWHFDDHLLLQVGMDGPNVN